MSHEETTRLLKIGEVAKQAGVGIETIRYYEREGLIPPPMRQRAVHHAGYRLYAADAVRRLRFILRAKELGFTLREIGALLALRTDQVVSRSEMRQKARLHLEDVEAKLRDLQGIRRSLLHLIGACEHGDQSSPCPILEFLDDSSSPSRKPSKRRHQDA
ncbi:MAG: MerR family transcriptional regulator [Candidatus Sumerlaeia bacterium]|nr:MerR family transcriptional regulator [Candidatus Sumerlaeia bacterium]